MSRTAASAVVPTVRPRSSGRTGRIADPVWIGFGAFLIGIAFSWLPSVWYDEAATITSATRTWPELARMVGTVDLVHAAYISVVHLWFDVVGYSPFTLRFPSAVGVGVATGGLVSLLQGFVPRRVAALGGVVFAMLPRTVWAGSEGRTYAIGIALAVGVAASYVFAARRASMSGRSQFQGWATYGAVALLACSWYIYLALLVAALGVTSLWSVVRTRASGPARRNLGGWALSSGAAAVILIPLVQGIVGQSGQVWWIPKIGHRTFHDVAVAQSFGDAGWLAVAMWALVALGILALLAGRAGRPEVPGPTGPTLIELFVPFIVIPAAGLIAASVLLSPLYSPRYLAFTTVGLAAFAAIGIAALPTRVLPAAALAGVLALAVPPAVAQRLPESKQHSSWAEAASLLARERAAEPAGTREAVVFGALRRHPSATTRVIEYSYPDAFAGLDDPALLVPARQSGQLWEERAPLEDVLGRFADDDTVWLFVSDEGAGAEEAAGELATVGLRPDGSWHLSYLDVVRFRR